ncbi:uncharacterized protein LOC111704546 isoform X3 [Eurytemora carolleeae]|uniref:uncharacterized protein LOC111704546 isoform X3 n=1 Tax=Eurytemora carolleeae TaxID=1294199 RepID=UPI000C794694|nr:uncharacterized protein LOC111704546 isoform X3 [Eurytemora carolleeae]|eukprot:XP_023332580.1 uncharacterized protein LOC111704546 isoform X3 [Eurytemora affinis]
MFLGGMFKMTLGRFSLVLLLLMMMVMRSNGKGSASNSIRELAKAAILKSWPFGDKQVMADLISEYEVFANSLDFDDCGKKFLCQMSGKKSEDLEWDEEMMVGKSSVGNCDAVYSNCLLTQEELVDSLRNQGLSVDIPGADRDCSFYFLWRSKKDDVKDE